MKKKIYIVGAVSGLSYDKVWRKFLNAETTINAMGHIPINPLRIVPKISPNATDEEKKEHWNKAMIILFPEVLGSDALYVLRDYGQSDGGRIEHFVGEVTKKEIIYQVNPH